MHFYLFCHITLSTLRRILLNQDQIRLAATKKCSRILVAISYRENSGCLKSRFCRFAENQVLPQIRQLPEALIISNISS